MRLNVWEYDPGEKEATDSLPLWKDFDISSLSASQSELVFEAGGNLYLMDALTNLMSLLKLTVVSDLSLEMPRSVDVSKRHQECVCLPEGKM